MHLEIFTEHRMSSNHTLKYSNHRVTIGCELT